jgi:hypothetical protein
VTNAFGEIGCTNPCVAGIRIHILCPFCVLVGLSVS